MDRRAQLAKEGPWIVFFDGYCHICSFTVRFITAFGNPKFIKVSSLQGETAQRLLGNYELPDSLIVFAQGEVLVEASAVIAVGKRLGGLWSILARMVSFLPRVFLDGLYRLVSKNRYGLLGKREECRLPSMREREFFLP